MTREYSTYQIHDFYVDVFIRSRDDDNTALVALPNIDCSMRVYAVSVVDSYGEVVECGPVRIRTWEGDAREASRDRPIAIAVRQTSTALIDGLGPRAAQQALFLRLRGDLVVHE